MNKVFVTAGIAVALLAPAAPVMAATPSPSSQSSDTSSNAGTGGVIDTAGPTTPLSAEKQRVVDQIAQAERSAKPDAAASTPYTYVALQYQVQQKNEWCVPASSRATISGFTSSLPSQTTLANQEGTSDTNGTSLTAISSVLNGYESRNVYQDYTQENSATGLFDLIQSNIDHFRAPLIPAIQGHYLSIWAADGLYGNHAIVLYGHSDANNIHYFDPLNTDSNAYGPHTTTSTIVFDGMTHLPNENLVL